MTIRLRLLQLLLLVLVVVLQLPAVHVQLADAYFSGTNTGEAVCSPETFWVKCGNACGDGSESDPFCSISSALDAAAGSTCGSTINVVNSWCAEDLDIRNNTAIVGQGSLTTIEGTITNDSGASMRLQDLAIYGTGTQAAVSVGGERAVTELQSVTIESATGYGVHQSGGSLSASSLLVVGTSTRDGGDLSGAAICLDGGVRATLDRIELYDNDVPGLVISGDTTWANLGDMRINETVHLLRVPGFVAAGETPGVEVLDGGLLTARWLNSSSR